MAGLGLLFSGLSAGGKALADTAKQDEQVSNENKLMQERARLEEEKALRIAEASRQATRQAGIQQGQDIQSATSALQNSRDAQGINEKFGSQMSADDAQVLRDQPAARQAYGLLSPTRQSDLEDRATAAENLGYLDAARETRGALQTEIGDQRNKANDENTNRRLDQQEKRQEQLDKFNQRREDRLDRLASAQLSFQQARAGKEDARAEQMAEREQRSATAAAMKGAETDIKQLQKELADPLMADEQKKVLQGQLETARADARRFRNALSGAGLEGSTTPSKAFNPDDYRIGGNAPKADASPAKTAQRASAPAPARGSSPVSAAPFEPGRANVSAQSPQALARDGLERAISQTARALAQATNSGNNDEAKRLQDILQEQQAARAKL